MNQPKVSLSIILPGSTMVSKGDSLKQVNKEFTTKKGKKIHKTILVEDYDKHDINSMFVQDKTGKERITYYTRKCKPASQSLLINKEAFIDMISVNNPEGIPLSQWKKMSKIQRLEWHLQRIVDTIDGISYSYQIFED